MSFAYSVAIKLSVANLASQGVKLLATDLLTAHGAATKLEDKLKALKMMAVGYGMSKVGSGILGFLEKSVDASKEYTRQLSLMNAAGMTQKDIAEATAAAWKTSKEVITSSAADNLTSLRELRTVFGKDHMHEAYSILPTVMRTKAILEALTGKEQHGVAFDMVKAIELRTSGIMTPERMQSNADLMARTLMAMGGTLDVRDFHSTLKQAKMSAFNLSDDFVYKYLPTFMQEVKTSGGGSGGGAQTAGTALMTTYRALVQGVIKKSAIPVWEELGLISPKDVVRNSTGALQLKPGAVKDVQLFQSNPYEWANTVLAPAVAKYGAKHNLNREQVLAAMFGDRNSQFFLNTLIGKSAQFERDKSLIETGGGSKETYEKLLQTNPQLAHQALQAQWQNIQARIGFEVLPRLIPYMIKFADTLDSVSQWMQNHGTATTALVFGLGGLGLALSVLGKVLMAAGLIKFLGMGPMIGTALRVIGTGIMFVGRALLMNPIGLVITAIAAAAYLLWKNWDYVGPKLKAAWDTIKSAVGALSDWLRSKWEWIKSFLPSSWFSGSDKSGTARSGGSPYISTKASHPIQVSTKISLDGRRVAEAVTNHQVKAAHKPYGGSAYDTTMGLPTVGLAYAD